MRFFIEERIWRIDNSHYLAEPLETLVLMRANIFNILTKQISTVTRNVEIYEHESIEHWTEIKSAFKKYRNWSCIYYE